MISRIIAAYRQRKAMERLDQLVQQTLSSYEHRQYLARRAAALKGRKVGA
jgi:hypothetical protein